MYGVYFVIKHKLTGAHSGPRGVSSAPHLYRTKGLAEGQLKSNYRYRNKDDYEVVKVKLTELKGE
jgi:hypothetical protein